MDYILRLYIMYLRASQVTVTAKKDKEKVVFYKKFDKTVLYLFSAVLLGLSNLNP